MSCEVKRRMKILIEGKLIAKREKSWKSEIIISE